MIAVNGRFLTMTPTGVQRYAREILRVLVDRLGDDITVVIPPNLVLRATDPRFAAAFAAEPVSQWHGVRGHLWEQATLPRLLRPLDYDVLWSPCHWGPLSIRRQVLVVHDVGPLVYPQYFDAAYRMLSRAMLGPLVRRVALVVASASANAGELRARFGLPADRVAVVPAGVGEPFTNAPLDDIAARPRRWCLLVGAHDERKNARFLVDLWPEVHRRTGLDLVLTRRSVVTTRGPGAVDWDSLPPSVLVRVDPTDDELVELYRGALCLLWPSRFEGYGIPLLEAMAVGTPFLSTDTGAASDLAVDRAVQVVPLDAERWVEQIVAWAGDPPNSIAESGSARARSLTWERAASRTAELLSGVSR